ncbi:MAG: metal-dependent hydrolase [Pirellulaceae bacterium]|nr:metal-dependent hydrolase [Pirellulaceae bacterium]
MPKLTWLSHGTWLIESEGHRVLLDPFLTENPSATISPDQLEPISHILISHGHFDHVADAAEIANQHGATIVAIFEIAQWFANEHGVGSTIGMNLGGATDLPFGNVKMVPALHSNSLPDGTYGGDPAGFLLTIEGERIYFACDTALFSDMKLHAHGVDVAVLPIGDLFTMGIDDSVQATKLIEPKIVFPAHYNTWPPIAQDAQEWAEKISTRTGAKPVVLTPGESYEL